MPDITGRVSEAFYRAVEHLFQQGGFTPDMMLQEPVIDLIEATAGVFNSAIDTGIKHSTPAALTERLRTDATMFSGFKVFNSLNESGLSLTDDKGNIKSWDAFRLDALKIDNAYNQNYLRTEYNFAIASAQGAARWADITAGGDDAEIQYRTAGDDHVRVTHQILNGITLPATHPFWENYFPPNDWGCRCTAIQVRKGKYPRTDSGAAMQLGETATSGKNKEVFRFNPGKQERVFPKRHAYNTSACVNCQYNTVQLAKNNNPLCEVCAQIRQIAEWKTKARRNPQEANTEVKNWINTSPFDSVKAPSLHTGKLFLSHRVVKNYLAHAYSSEAKWIVTKLEKSADRLTFVSSAGITPGKERQKHKMGIWSFNYYTFNFMGKDWDIAKGISKDGAREMPYSIRPKK